MSNIVGDTPIGEQKKCLLSFEKWRFVYDISWPLLTFHTQCSAGV